jgi:restriction system protein
MSPEERVVGLAAATLFLLIAWFVWRRNFSTVDLLVLAGLAIFWWQAISGLRAVRRIYETREQLAALTPEQFEQWCAHRLRTLGYTVRHVGGQGDHGVDLFAEKDRELAVVQCKRFTGSRTVGEPQIRDLFGAMHGEGASRALVITAGYFTAEARAWARGKSIELWDVDHIVKLPSGARPPTPDAPRVPIAAADVATQCGQCGSELLVRRNRSTGQSFYGCARYPSCRFTRPIEVRATAAN